MRACFFFSIGIVLALARGAMAADLPRTEAKNSLALWAVEQMPGGTVTMKQDGVLEIDDVGGGTVWSRQRLLVPIVIEYDVTVVSAGGPNDRVSDLNCFWMANEPHPAGQESPPPYEHKPARTGKFSDYDSLLTYYVGYGGNGNTTSRFRRYDGTAARPLLPEHDLRAPQFLLEANHRYHIRLVARKEGAEFWCDGRLIFNFRDPAPLTSGWFGFRTVHSHLLIRDFRVSSP